MKIESIYIKNFRCFKEDTIFFDDYTCLVGANGAGKSTLIKIIAGGYPTPMAYSALMVKVLCLCRYSPDCLIINFPDFSNAKTVVYLSVI